MKHLDAAKATLLAILSLTPPAMAGTLEDARERGYIEIGIANAPPYAELTSEGKIAGAEPEIVVNVLKRLGIKEVRANLTEYGAMIPGLQARRFDVIGAAMFMNPKRCEAVLFSKPDTCDTAAFAVAKGNPHKLATYADIARASATVAVCGGCIEEQRAREAGVNPGHIVTVPDEQSAMKMLRDGRVDVYAYPTVTLQNIVRKNNIQDVDLVSPLKDVAPSCAGAAFRKEDKDFRDAYDAELTKMQESGEFTKILDSYDFSADAALATSRDKLCEGPN